MVEYKPYGILIFIYGFWSSGRIVNIMAVEFKTELPNRVGG